MTRGPSGRYSKEFRREAVKLVVEGGVSAYEASRQLSLPKSTLENWVRAFRAGKRGRGAEGKKPVPVAVETRKKGAGFVAMKAVDAVSKETVSSFLAFHIQPGKTIRTDALPALNVIGDNHIHEKKVTPPHKASEWLPLVHIMIGNMKKFINGTFHGVSANYLQEYLDEFCYRFNRRFWEPELPLRLLNACLVHTPVKIAEFC